MSPIFNIALEPRYGRFMTGPGSTALPVTTASVTADDDNDYVAVASLMLLPLLFRLSLVLLTLSKVTQSPHCQH